MRFPLCESVSVVAPPFAWGAAYYHRLNGRLGFTIAYTDTPYALATWPGAWDVLPGSPESERKLTVGGK